MANVQATSGERFTSRPAAVAGSFYPAEAGQLRNMVQDFLEAARTDEPPPKAMIVPHAGYVYSGPIAATAYARLFNLHHPVRRVVLLGPAHRVGFYGIAATSAGCFETPLGDVPVDVDAVADVVRLPTVFIYDEAHLPEHSLEVHLPFLQLTLGDTFSLVPLVVGSASGDEVAEVIERLWGGDETLIVVSSDLSHYLDYETARRTDAATMRAIAALDPEAIQPGQACGRVPIQGLLKVAKRHGLAAEVVDLRNSGDTAGPRNQVVGYGACILR